MKLTPIAVSIVALLLIAGGYKKLTDAKAENPTPQAVRQVGDTPVYAAPAQPTVTQPVVVQQPAQPPVVVAVPAPPAPSVAVPQATAPVASQAEIAASLPVPQPRSTATAQVPVDPVTPTVSAPAAQPAPPAAAPAPKPQPAALGKFPPAPKKPEQKDASQRNSDKKPHIINKCRREFLIGREICDEPAYVVENGKRLELTLIEKR